MSPDLLTGLLIGVGATALVSALVLNLIETRKARRENERLRAVLSGALESIGRLAHLVAQIEPRAAVPALRIANAVRQADATVPASGIGGAAESSSAGTGPLPTVVSEKQVKERRAAQAKARNLTDAHHWAVECKRNGWKDGDGNELEGEDRQDAERLAAEAEGVLEGVRAA